MSDSDLVKLREAASTAQGKAWKSPAKVAYRDFASPERIISLLDHIEALAARVESVRNATLEESAKIADSWHMVDINDGHDGACIRIASAIRSLATQSPPPVS